MFRLTLRFLVAMAVMLTGCVSETVHQRTLKELDEARQATAQAASAVENVKKEAAAELERAKSQIAAQMDALRTENSRLAEELRHAQTRVAQAQEAVDAANKGLVTEREGRLQVETQGKKIREDHEKLLQEVTEVKAVRDQLQGKADDLQRRLDTAQQDLAGVKKAQTGAHARVAAIEKEKEQLATSLGEARDQIRDLTTKLATEQVKAGTLREEKQRLLSGTTKPQEEIARLQKRSADLDTEAARAADLAKQLAERDHEIARLRQGATDRETLAAKVTSLTEELERAKQRVTTLTNDLANVNDDLSRLRQERDRLDQQLRLQKEGR